LPAPVVSITVVVYNSDHTLADCLRSVRPAVQSGLAELIVVDNASPDRSAELVARDFPEARLLRSPSNDGFAAGCNRGWVQARGRYWLLLNPDVTVPPGGLEGLVAWADAHPELGAVSPELVDEAGHAGCAARRFPSIGRSLLELSRLHRLLPAAMRARVLLGGYWRGPGDRLDADWVPATALLVRREAVEAAGPLAVDLPLYGEDTEWCWRIRRAGFGIGLCGSLRFLHRESASTRRTFGDEERDRRLWHGVYAGVARSRGRLYARVLTLVNLVSFAVEAAHPGRQGRERADARRHLAAHRQLWSGWRPAGLPGSSARAAGETSWT
jgi:N-acetylglucosaminyl-diphospho-decaprenol L-rhamnosyltransferase